MGFDYFYTLLKTMNKATKYDSVIIPQTRRIVEITGQDLEKMFFSDSWLTIISCCKLNVEM